jgi:hypothetical protein
VGEERIVSLRARERCMAISTSMVRWRSLAWGSLGSKERGMVGEWRGRLVSLAPLDRRRMVTGVPGCTSEDAMIPGSFPGEDIVVNDEHHDAERICFE